MWALSATHRRGDALDLDGAEVAALEEIADQPARARGDNDRPRLGQGLQASREVWGLADDRLLLSRAFADQIADHYQPGGDPDPRLEVDGFDVEPADSLDDTQTGSYSALGIVLMRLRVAEINKHAVAHVLGDEAVEPGHGAVISGNDLAQILRIETRGKRGRADEIAERYSELPPLGIGSHRRIERRGGWRLGSDRGDGVEQPAAMASEHHTKVFQIIRCQLGQCLEIDLIIAEGGLVAFETKAP